MNGAALLVAALVVPAAAWAVDSCPWINTATVRGALGAPVNVSVAQEIGRTSCVFSFEGNALTAAVRVEVEPGAKVIAPLCVSPSTVLRALGNEAQVCSGKASELVFGRVRDQRFRVEVIESGNERSRGKLRKAAISIAAQIAGNLF